MTATCPTCRKPSRREGNKLFPFCSERCQLVDLGRWFDEEYRVPEEIDAGGTPNTGEDGGEHKPS
jgi:endogenous inhibitor of DNA gyrase (YacG/DUF329 family)